MKSKLALLFLGTVILSSSPGTLAAPLVSSEIQGIAQREASFERDYELVKKGWFSNNQLQSLSLEDKVEGLSEDKLPILIDVLWNEKENQGSGLTQKYLELYHFIPSLESLSQRDRVRVSFMGLKAALTNKIKRALKRDLYHLMEQEDLPNETVLSILSNYDLNELSESKLRKFQKRFGALTNTLAETLSPGKMMPSRENYKSLVEFKPDLDNLMKGVYADSMTAYLFCRTNRSYPCLMILKDKHGNWVRNEDGTLWNDPKLAKSAKGLAYNQPNGNTPTGVYTMDSVMPVADDELVYGKFRRVILNFIKPTKNETRLKALMPKELQAFSWWKQSQVARDVGRNLLRIHGTGRTANPANIYFPLTPSYGCVKSREGTYDNITYYDQRDLLDQMMMSLELEPTYANEVGIRGLLYVAELDSQKKAVELSDLEGIVETKLQPLEEEPAVEEEPLPVPEAAKAEPQPLPPGTIWLWSPPPVFPELSI